MSADDGVVAHGDAVVLGHHPAGSGPVAGAAGRARRHVGLAAGGHGRPGRGADRGAAGHRPGHPRAPAGRTSGWSSRSSCRRGRRAGVTTCSYLMMRRLFTVSETALATVRARTFRHIHDLSMLHQQAERRGTLTSRVTSDIDQITQFLQWGGVILFVSAGQIVVTTIVMAVYSWQLTLVVYAAFLPLVIVVRLYQRRLAAPTARSAQRVGAMLGAVGESVVGAEVIRAYGVASRPATGSTGRSRTTGGRSSARCAPVSSRSPPARSRPAWRWPRSWWCRRAARRRRPPQASAS